MNSLTKILALSATMIIVGSACASPQKAGGTTTTTLPATGANQLGIPVRGEIQHTIVGKVTDIDRADGRLTVETSDGSKVKLKVPAFALASVRKGEPVSLNVTATGTLSLRVTDQPQKPAQSTGTGSTPPDPGAIIDWLLQKYPRGSP